MNESQCMARLLASAVHDMRNVLAVIRESAGAGAGTWPPWRPARGGRPGTSGLPQP